MNFKQKIIYILNTLCISAYPINFMYFSTSSNFAQKIKNFIEIRSRIITKVINQHLPALIRPHANGERFCKQEKEKERNRKLFFGRLTLDDHLANAERISAVTIDTSTHCMMIHHRTLCVQTAQTDTRIATLLLHTRQMWRTLGINRTLRPAIWRNTDVILDARTRCTVTTHLTLRVRTARGWLTWIRCYWWLL